MRTALISFWLLLLLFEHKVLAKKIPVYYLKSKYDYRNMIDWTKPDIDCVHTVGEPLPFPEKITVCVRMMHITYENPVVSSYATAFAFGTFNADMTELEEGTNRDTLIRF